VKDTAQRAGAADRRAVCRPGTNLTSRLRVYCAEELRRRLMGALLPLTSRNLIGIAEIAGPLPGHFLNKKFIVNQPFIQWFRTDNPVLGIPWRAIFGFVRPPFDEVWGEFAEGAYRPSRPHHQHRTWRVRATALLRPLAFRRSRLRLLRLAAFLRAGQDTFKRLTRGPRAMPICRCPNPSNKL
jgi:hypothetical protein